MRSESVSGYRIDSRDVLPAKPHPTDYLRQTRTAAYLLDTLRERAAEEGSKCLDDPDPWLEYEPEQQPTREEAAALCAGCPLLALCDQYATVARPAHGVWGGRVRGTL